MPKINETFARKAEAPASGNKVYRDDDQTGFGLRVTAAGARSFVLAYTIHKRERRFTIGAFPAWTAAAAREEARKLRRQIDQGIDPLEQRSDTRDAPTLQDLWQEYERVHLPTLSPRSASDQASMWRRYILPKMKHVRLEELSSREIDALHAQVSGVGTTRANRVIEMLRKALNLASAGAGSSRTRPWASGATPSIRANAISSPRNTSASSGRSRRCRTRRRPRPSGSSS